MKTIINGIVHENPTFVLLLGLCPALAVTNKFESAYIMGLCVLIILLFSNFVISLIKKLVPDSVKIPVYILIIGTFVTIVELLLKSYVPSLYSILGIYLPLIVVNCIVLGRALVVASKEKVGKSMLDAIGIGTGFAISLMIIALFREVLGTNTITLLDGLSSITGYKAIYQVLPTTNLLPITIFKDPAGAFLTLGILLGVFNAIRDKKGRGELESN
jgi:electron transport complex protein RnfE